MKALINIDYTVDFVADTGSLTCGAPGQAIHDALLALTKSFVEAGDFVVFAIDRHAQDDPYHPETALFPPHNIVGTEGRALYGELAAYHASVKHAPNVHTMDKSRYSAFHGTDLEIKLRERGITEVHLVGVCTDICVLHTAVDAYNRGFKIVVHQNAVASFDAAGHAWALGHFQNVLGAQVV
ncbi:MULTISPECIES: cysteine hydrolase family protein [unclassified Halomonas]|uniref:cysteine hydrolase family protein n=1 Tax=unclassified Halomonas TaxID=2609666 RepID=UPI0021E403FB|nr:MULTISPECIES: isochorismatase family cysteine hydrolase [unclassified Halomonas]UYF99121.1 cysteine hydrolase [Halomonas sp. GD1P12]WNL39723.1 isochorismatase family cysteine hydrolase [Halomonas sp. PAMB 3232]